MYLCPALVRPNANSEAILGILKQAQNSICQANAKSL
jgi:hypothetical protein